MSKFEMRNHTQKLTLDGGKEGSNGDVSYFCPVCKAKNFKVNKKTGRWFAWGCSCSQTEEGKRLIRETVSPAKLNKPKKVTEYIFKNKEDFELIKVIRTDNGDGTKTIRQESLISGKRPSEFQKVVVPYRYKEAQRALEEGHEYVYWVEGEQCCDALWRIDLPAISTIGGSKFYPERDSKLFPANKVVVVPDLDDVGIKYANEVARNYEGCKIIRPFPDHHNWATPPASGGIDIADWLASGANKTDIFKQLEQDITPDNFIKDARSLKERLDAGLSKVDKLPIIERAFAMETLKNELKLKPNQFETLVNTLINFKESEEPETLEAIMASDTGLTPVIDDLLAVGLTMLVGDGYSGKSSFSYQLLEAVSNGAKFAGQFQTRKANTLIVQLDEPLANAKAKFRRMGFAPDPNCFRIKWHFHPLMIPELITWIVTYKLKVIVLDSLIKIAGGFADICSAEFGLLIYRLNKIASKYDVSIVLVHHLNRDPKRQAQRVPSVDDIYGSKFIFNGCSDVYTLYRKKEEGSSEYSWLLKNLKARSTIVEENEIYEFSGNSEDFRFYFEALGSRTISLDEINNKTKRVKQFLLNNPTEAFSPKQVSVACELNNANWAGNILAQLNGRGEIKRINATTLTTGGRRPYLYKAK